MTNRRIMWIALAFAILVQAGFVFVYHEMLTGCCGGLLQATQPDPPPPFAMWFVEVTAYPMVHVALIGRSHGGGFAIADWAHAVVFAAINAVFWSLGTFLLLKGLVLLCRVRAGRAGRLRLAAAAEVPSRSVGLAVLILIVLAMSAGALHRRWWLAEAQRTLHAAIVSVRTGGELPDRVTCNRYGLTGKVQPSDFAGAYTLNTDERFAGRHPLDRFVPPYPWWSGEVTFRNGSTYSFTVSRRDRRWNVHISPR